MATRDEMARSFGAQAGAYERGRPTYPVEAVAWLLEGVGDAARVADVGAGTGKLTAVVSHLMAERGGEVIAVDPDAAMLDTLRATLPGTERLVGTAEHVNLPDESVDAVVLGQAWHWVDPVAASAELGRILKPGGTLGLIWNSRDESVPWVARLGGIMQGSNAELYLAVGGPSSAPPFEEFEEHQWRWVRTMMRDELLAMVHSRSYVITASEDERARIDDEVGALLDEMGVAGEASVELPYVTRAFRSTRR